MDGSQTGATLPDLVAVMRRLLSPEGCPWDREQTFESLRPYVIEEAHEVVEAIDSGESEALREELGDLLFQIVFQSELARARGWFGVDGVIAAIGDKLRRRHPHVFGDAKVTGTADVLRNWEAIKAQEKPERGLFDGVPVALPALQRAVQIGRKAARIGFDWPDVAGPRAKVDEELGELDAALATDDREAAEGELGDVLFALCSLARKRGLDPEAALRGTLARFTGRVEAVRDAAAATGHRVDELPPDALQRLWDAEKARAPRTG